MSVYLDSKGRRRPSLDLAAEHISPTGEVIEVGPRCGQQVEDLSPGARRLVCPLAGDVGAFHAGQQTAGAAYYGSVTTTHS